MLRVEDRAVAAQRPRRAVRDLEEERHLQAAQPPRQPLDERRGGDAADVEVEAHAAGVGIGATRPVAEPEAGRHRRARGGRCSTRRGRALLGRDRRAVVADPLARPPPAQDRAAARQRAPLVPAHRRHPASRTSGAAFAALSSPVRSSSSPGAPPGSRQVGVAGGVERVGQRAEHRSLAVGAGRRDHLAAVDGRPLQPADRRPRRRRARRGGAGRVRPALSHRRSARGGRAPPAAGARGRSPPPARGPPRAESRARRRSRSRRRSGAAARGAGPARSSSSASAAGPASRQASSHSAATEGPAAAGSSPSGWAAPSRMASEGSPQTQWRTYECSSPPMSTPGRQPSISR